MSGGTIPALRGRPIVGLLPEFRSDVLGVLNRVAHDCGDIGLLQIGPWKAVMLNSADYAQRALVDQASRLRRYERIKRVLRPLLGRGLLNIDGELHHLHRQQLAPVFQYRHIVHLVAPIVTITQRRRQRWTDGVVLDILAESHHMTREIIGRFLFGVDIAQDTPQIGEDLDTVLAYVADRSTAVIAAPGWWPAGKPQQFRTAIKRLDAFVAKIVDEIPIDAGEATHFVALLQQAYGWNAQDPGSFQRIRDEAMTMLQAGHETTAVALAWTLYMIAKHPDVAETVHQELERVLAGRPPTADDLPQLPYLQRVLKESLRLYPPVFVIPRVVVEPLEIGPYTIAPGTGLGVSPFVIHRDPLYFPDPERFDPDRFLSPAADSRPRGSYLPFGAGPHVCIGAQLAMIEAQLVLATVLQTTSFELVGEPQGYAPLVTLRPRGAIHLRVRSRNA